MPVTLEKIPGQEERVILSMGPQHPSTHGVLRLVLELEGETVIRAKYDIGYLHTGFEKSFESKTYTQGITLTDRMDYLALLTRNPIWLRRTQGVGYMSAGDAVALGVSGPSLRGSGVKWDLRRNQPYSSYDKFDFDVPTRPEGDVYARYRVRMAEMRES